MEQPLSIRREKVSSWRYPLLLHAYSSPARATLRGGQRLWETQKPETRWTTVPEAGCGRLYTTRRRPPTGAFLCPPSSCEVKTGTVGRRTQQAVAATRACRTIADSRRVLSTWSWLSARVRSEEQITTVRQHVIASWACVPASARQMGVGLLHDASGNGNCSVTTPYCGVCRMQATRESRCAS